MWIHRAAFNVRQLGATGLRFKPGSTTVRGLVLHPDRESLEAVPGDEGDMAGDCRPVKLAGRAQVGAVAVVVAVLAPPYQAMKEIWRATADPSNWQGERRSALLPWWWLFWLLYTFAGQAAMRLSLRAEEVNELLVANVVMQVSDLLSVPVCLVFLAIMRRVLTLQTAHADRIRPVRGELAR